MRIISWNCNGKFRTKWREISGLDADVYVVQECERPDTVLDPQFSEFAAGCIWKGDKPFKGIGVFAKQGVHMERLMWNDHLLRHFIPVRIDGSLTVLAVWACAPYIEEYAVYQDIHIDKFGPDTVIIGDFNSNRIWDNKRTPYRSHSGVVEKLAEKGLSSAYHALTGEEQGAETSHTLYMFRNRDKGYHIDYCFLDRSRIRRFQILDDWHWLQFSDHMPIVLDI